MNLTYEINIDKEITELEKDIVRKYWDFEENEFKNRPALLKNEYNLSQSELLKVIQKKSTCILNSGNCFDCEIELIYNITSQSNFLARINPSNIRCAKCHIEYNRKLKQEREENHISYGAQIQTEAFRYHVWGNLSSIEFEVLFGIIRYKESNEIYKKVHNRFGWNETWVIVNKLEKMGLINLIRNENNNILKFNFLEELENEILNYAEIKGIGNIEENEGIEVTQTIIKNNLSFSLMQKIYKTKPTQPDYSGLFRLPNDIVLKKGIDYMYGGWVQSDGSINLKFTPKDEVIENSTFQKNIESQPEYIKDIISGMRNNLDSFEDNEDDDFFPIDFDDDKNDKPF